MTSSAGWNLPAFPGRKRNPEHGERLEPDFDRKRANLEAQAPRLTSDTEKTNFSELAVLSAFCTKNGAVTKR